MYGFVPKFEIDGIEKQNLLKPHHMSKFQLTTMSTSATVARAIWSISLRNRGARSARLRHGGEVQCLIADRQEFCPKIEEFRICTRTGSSGMHFYGDDFGEHWTESRWRSLA